MGYTWLNKKKIGNFFTQFGMILIVIFSLSYISFYYILKGKDELKANEKIQFFISGYGIKDYTYEEEIKEILKNLKYFDVMSYSFSPYDKNISSYYDKFGTYSDILVLREKDLVDMDKYVEDKYIQFTDKIIKQLSIDQYEKFTFDTKIYGLKIHSVDTIYNNKYSFDKWNEFSITSKEEENYYLVLNKSSYNFKDYIDDNNSNFTNNGIKAFNVLMNKYGSTN